MKPGEIYDIVFPFDPPDHGYKLRPALILKVDNGQALAVAIKITGTGPKPQFPHRIPITFWNYANLSKMSYAQIDSQTLLNIQHLPAFRGNMHPSDLNRVLTSYLMLHSK
ncbi:hypothetical protein AZ46_0214485 [Metabacillus indicus LMG 22858]|nr:hypothetical protein AZ46_0214485 [Metabacillus indicus LMG 22858]